MERRRIHILCLKSEICSLIKKTLTLSGYEVTCSGGDEINQNTIEEINEMTECLIIDTDIDYRIREMAKEKFGEKSIICLPSLESESISGAGTKRISEPLKLSELSEAVKSVFKTS